jgi:hypothetical protein
MKMIVDQIANRCRVGKIADVAGTRGQKQTSLRSLRKLDCAARTILPTRTGGNRRAFAHPTELAPEEK